MTYVVKTRGAPGLLIAEYRCPTHGIFEVTVQRTDAGDAPDEQPCPASLFVDSATGCCEDFAGACGASSPWIPSAPKPKVATVVPTAAVRGGDMAERPPWMLDTRPLADGMSYSEWSKKQDKLQTDHRRQQLIDGGAIEKKIIVGGT